MSEKYLIPQFIIDYLQKSKNSTRPQNLIGMRLKKNRTPEIEKWFKDNEVTASYIWRFFVFYGLNEFSFRECPVCGKRVKLSTILTAPNAKYCSLKCQSLSKEVQEKRKQTWLEKYGVKNPNQCKDIKEKKKETTLLHYGVENPAQCETVKEKQKQTCLKKYGNYFLQTKDFKETKRSEHWETFCSHLKTKNILPLFSKEDYINNTGRRFKCLLCDKEFKTEGTSNYKKDHKNKDGSYSILSVNHIFCPYCFKAHVSKKEKEVLEFVRTLYEGEILENDRIQLGGRELDIFLPSLNVAIEFDGDYWHSLEKSKERDEKKNRLCEQKGIRLLRIKESDWDNNREEAENRIKEFLI